MPRCLQNILQTSSRRLAKESSRHLQDIFKTSSRRFQDVLKTSPRLIQEVLKTSSRRPQEALQGSLQDVLKMYYQVKQFLLNVFKMTLRRIQNVSEKYCKDGCLQKDLSRSHLWEIYGQYTEFARYTKVFEILVSHFTAHFSGSFQIHI